MTRLSCWLRVLDVAVTLRLPMRVRPWAIRRASDATDWGDAGADTKDGPW